MYKGPEHRVQALPVEENDITRTLASSGRCNQSSRLSHGTTASMVQ